MSLALERMARRLENFGESLTMEECADCLIKGTQSWLQRIQDGSAEIAKPRDRLETMERWVHQNLNDSSPLAAGVSPVGTVVALTHQLLGSNLRRYA